MWGWSSLKRKRGFRDATLHLKGWLYGQGHIYQTENDPSLGGCRILLVTGAGLWNLPGCVSSRACGAEPAPCQSWVLTHQKHEPSHSKFLPSCKRAEGSSLWVLVSGAPRGLSKAKGTLGTDHFLRDGFRSLVPVSAADEFVFLLPWEGPLICWR